MKRIKDFLHFIHTSWTFLMFTFFMLLATPFVIIPVLVHEKKGGAMAAIVLKIWAFCFSGLSGIFYQTQGREKLAPNKAYIFVVNHSSFMDGPAIVMGIPDQFRALGKKEIMKMPLFGFIFKHIGVMVDRSSKESRKKSFSAIKRKIEHGTNVVIFPEGTMNKTGEKPLMRFYDGAFQLAIQTQSEIVPMVIHNCRDVWKRGDWRVHPQTIRMQILDPIATTGLDIADMPRLKEQTHQLMEQALVSYRAKRAEKKVLSLQHE